MTRLVLVAAAAFVLSAFAAPVVDLKDIVNKRAVDTEHALKDGTVKWERRAVDTEHALKDGTVKWEKRAVDTEDALKDGTSGKEFEHDGQNEFREER
ncbi:hypothetical protein CYLTODRAFT_452775 [Cylindrobasidium torrendii FP15055 ss-10]|uniref:Uncharacterized protein n=1 Tax=Cylindrobasidium torrendii FP15055 ss-10 TaxID=1314674 RepID=A0A0D7BFH0_9AGAR|nr:hypothetical protein CYLTODRAFT_452775 [Cylindrobasidium torrendii FP15055 ss-10]